MQIHISNPSLINLYILYYEQFADSTVKCIEDEIPFELPDGWAWERLSNLAPSLEERLLRHQTVNIGTEIFFGLHPKI